MSEVEIMHPINQELIDSSMNYNSYKELLNQLFEEGKTTGENQSAELLNYAKMNLQRMKRLDKTVSLNDSLSAVIDSADLPEMIWLVITEGWCGDAAQNIPLLNKIAKKTNQIDLRFILRDGNLEVMDQHLTNGGRAIPKLIALEPESLNVIGTWGPRPKEPQKLVDELKKQEGVEYSVIAEKMQLWYARDKTQAQQTELLECLIKWS